VDPDPSWIAARTSSLTLADGEVLTVRPIVPADKESLRSGMAALSRESRYRRFFSAVQQLSDQQLVYFTEIDYHDHFAWVAIAGDPSAPVPRGVAVARYIRDRDDADAAEFAIAVLDEYQGRGLGSRLLEQLARTAYEHDVRTFIATVLAENDPMLEVARHLGAKSRFLGDGLVRVDIPLPVEPDDFRDTAPYRMLRAAFEVAPD
jgi:GNAT superfamily N-acetyltransferase